MKVKEADHLPKYSRTPLRHLIIPEVFRLLYCCGMRLNEVLMLHVTDVNLSEGILKVLKGKFKKDRLVPIPLSMTARLKKYSIFVGKCKPDDIFFPAPDGGYYSKNAIYNNFRRLLKKCNIPHLGKGRGPRLHDLRHTFCCHRLETWYRENADIGNKLPLLSTYLGHIDLTGTQRYLRITPEIFPEIVNRLEKFTGNIINWRNKK